MCIKGSYFSREGEKKGVIAYMLLKVFNKKGKKWGKVGGSG